MYSIIIPVYNSEKYLFRCIDSVIYNAKYELSEKYIKEYLMIEMILF